MPIENMYYLMGIIIPISMATIAMFRFFKDKVKKYIREIVREEINDQTQKSNWTFLRR